MNPISQTSGNAPIAKIANSFYVGSSVTVAVWILKTYLKTDIPPDVASAMTLLLSGIAGYLTPLRQSEVQR